MGADVLGDLVGLSKRLGEPANDYAILGEGNTSARIDGASFWVKASGASLRTAGRDDFVRVAFEGALALLDQEAPTDDEVREGLAAAALDREGDARPSVETLMHAVLLELEGVAFVGHTHPTAINMITCSGAFADALAGRLFPDEVVLCGLEPVLVPYVDPGVPLAREVRRGVAAHVDAHGEPPKTLYMQNHGFIALGSTPRQVEDVTAMAVKAARTLVGTYALGGPRFLDPGAARRIHTRPDEHHRRRVIGRRGS